MNHKGRLSYLPAILLLTLHFTGVRAQKPLFRLLEGKQTGIDFVNPISETENQNVMSYEYYYNGGGVAVGDNSVVIGEGVQVPGSSVLSYHLNVGGVRFDSLTISVSGPTGIPDYALMGIDNVRIELIPEPGALMLFLALASTLTMYRRRD